MKQMSRQKPRRPLQARWLAPLSLLVWSSLQSQVQAESNLSLQQAIDRAVGRSTEVAIAEAELQAQVERKRQSWTNIGPRVTATYAETRFENRQTADLGAQTLIIRDDVTKMGALVATQPITGLYGIIEYGRMNGLQVELSDEALRRAKRDAGFGAATSFLQAYQAQEKVRIAETSTAAAKSALKDAQSMARVGNLAQADLLKIQLALSQAETRLAQARAAHSISLTQLRQTIQWDRDEALVLDSKLPTQPELSREAGSPQPNPERSELRSAKLQSEMADFSKKLAYAKLIPSVNLFARWDRNLAEITGLGGQRDIKSYGVNLQWDIWTNGSSFFEVREAAALKIKAEAAVEGMHNIIHLDMTQAYENTLACQDSLRLAREAISQAEEVYRIDQLRFKSGQITATDLIRSESERSSASGNVINAETDLLLWHLRLQKASGRDLPTLAQQASA